MPPHRRPRVKTVKTVETEPRPDFIFKRRCLLDTLPIELLQQIGLEFHQVIDLKRFSSICVSTYHALESDKRAFWRRRFLKSFDNPDWISEVSEVDNNNRFKRQYMCRQNILSGVTLFYGFASGFHDEETMTLGCLHALIKEASFTVSQTTGEIVSRNIKALRRFVRRAGVYRLFEFDPLEDDARAYSRNGAQLWHPLLQMIQCMLAPSILTGSTHRDTVLGFSISQAIVYASQITRPLFRGGTIDFDTLLHHVNFWKYHFLFDETGAITEWYSDLPTQERPSYWTAKLSNARLTLGKSWKGTYAYLDNHAYFRYGPDGTTVNGQRGEEILQDNFLGNGEGSPFQDMELKVCSPKDHFWPAIFENYLHTMKPRPRPVTRAQGRTYQEVVNQLPPVPISACVTGGGTDHGDQFCMSGWLEQMPDQHNMPGWSRITLMKYYIDDMTQVVDDEALWAYEGVVLAGGRIIVGRWWHPTPFVDLRHVYRGPFILWAVDGDDTVEQ